MTDLELGDRVYVKGHWNWPDCTGTIAEPPDAVQSLVADEHPWRGHTRVVPGRTRLITFVWIVFDQPQRDSDGDGPYRIGEVEVEFVAKVAEPIS